MGEKELVRFVPFTVAPKRIKYIKYLRTSSHIPGAHEQKDRRMPLLGKEVMEVEAPEVCPPQLGLTRLIAFEFCYVSDRVIQTTTTNLTILWTCPNSKKRQAERKSC